MSIRLHAKQSEVFKAIMVDKVARHFNVCCARGFGKSYVAAVVATSSVFELMALSSRVPNKNVYIIAPTHDQATDIYFPLLNYEIGLEAYAIKSSKDEGRFVFPNSTQLRLLSYESVERMRGKGAYTVVWDEVSSCTKGVKPQDAWESIIEPCISTRWSAERARMYGAPSPGRSLHIGTPKGFNFFYDTHHYQEHDKRWKSFKFDYTQSPLLDKLEIEEARHNMDPIRFASEYLADFKESGNSVFYCFDRSIHVRDDLPYFVQDDQQGEDIHVSIDFNVGLQCSAAFAIRGNQVHYLDEFKGHPDTEELAKTLRAKYKNHKIYAYPDPSGRARKSSAPVGRTDFTILESYGITCLARPKAPPIVDSASAVNRKLKTASGRTEFYVHPKCKGLIMSLERTRWVDNNPDIAVIDKSDGVEHFSDGVRYAMEFLYPAHVAGKRTARGFGF
jgi:hypothetical protein